jgi:hypothetical protein
VNLKYPHNTHKYCTLTFNKENKLYTAVIYILPGGTCMGKPIYQYVPAKCRSKVILVKSAILTNSESKTDLSRLVPFP